MVKQLCKSHCKVYSTSIGGESPPTLTEEAELTVSTSEAANTFPGSFARMRTLLPSSLDGR